MKSKKMIIFAFIATIIVIAIVFIRSGQKRDLKDFPQKTASNYLMNTLIQLRIYGENAEDLINISFERLREIENNMSKTIENSDIYRINENQSENGFVHISTDTFRVLEKAIEYAQITEGRFDPSIGPLVELWGIGTKDARIPRAEEINETISRVNYKWIELNSNDNSIRLLKDQMKLDLGAIAKGYAADEVRDILEGEGIESAYINLGGNVFVIGGKPDGTSWNIGIQDPRRNRGGAMASIEVKDKTIVTSGNYERYFEKNGVIYHHIIDPTTGYPAESGILSVSIISDDSFDADALSTSVFILGVEKGLELINKLEGVEALIIKDDLGIIMTDGLQNNIIIRDKDFYLSGK